MASLEPNQQLVQSRGIYHGLPVYPSNLKGLTAIITGANGISGNYMLRVLAQAPDRWSKIYCLSRRPPLLPGGLLKNAEHIAVDFLQKPEEIAAVLKERGVKADYVFFYSYVQPAPKEGGPLWSDAEEMCRVNVALLQNFCDALPIASIQPKRIMLQTGAKNYGIHLGPAATPQEESHPRITLEPNFYYPQEDLLSVFCSSHNTSYTICMPSYIHGAVPSAAMNLVFPLAIYASVCRHLNAPLDFPSDLIAWEATQVQSSAMLNGYMEEWAVFQEGAKGEKFNTVDGGPFTWGGFWPKFASWYGLEVGRPKDGDEYFEITTQYDPPPRGFGPKGTYRRKFLLSQWARKPEVQKAWAELIQKHNLEVDKLEDMEIDRIFGFTDQALMGGTLDMSMNKARKMGWHGFVDSVECVREVLDDFAKIKMAPPVA